MPPNDRLESRFPFLDKLKEAPGNIRDATGRVTRDGMIEAFKAMQAQSARAAQNYNPLSRPGYNPPPFNPLDTLQAMSAYIFPAATRQSAADSAARSTMGDYTRYGTQLGRRESPLNSPGYSDIVLDAMTKAADGARGSYDRGMLAIGVNPITGRAAERQPETQYVNPDTSSIPVAQTASVQQKLSPRAILEALGMALPPKDDFKDTGLNRNSPGPAQGKYSEPRSK